MKMHIFAAANGNGSERWRRRHLTRVQKAEKRLLSTAKKIDLITQANRQLIASYGVENKPIAGGGVSSKSESQSSKDPAIVGSPSINDSREEKSNRCLSCLRCLCCRCGQRRTDSIYSQSEKRDKSHDRSGLGLGRRAVAGFIIFEYNESFARCLDDYAHLDKFPVSLVKNLIAPHQLRLNGRLLNVCRAPEPDQIIWENLEVSTTTPLPLLNLH